MTIYKHTDSHYIYIYYTADCHCIITMNMMMMMTINTLNNTQQGIEQT